MKRILLALLIIIVVTLFQPIVAGMLSPALPLVHFLPIFLVLWADQLEDSALVWVVVAGGLLADFLVPETFGSSPVVWGIVAAFARTQHSFIVCYGLAYAALVTFAMSFLFLTLSRLIFLLFEGGWSWPQDLTFYLFTASALNAAISPLIFILLRPVFRAPKKESPYLSHVYT